MTCFDLHVDDFLRSADMSIQCVTGIQDWRPLFLLGLGTLMLFVAIVGGIVVASRQVRRSSVP